MGRNLKALIEARCLWSSCSQVGLSRIVTDVMVQPPLTESCPFAISPAQLSRPSDEYKKRFQ